MIRSKIKITSRDVKQYLSGVIYDESELPGIKSAAPRYAETLNFISKYLKCEKPLDILDIGTGEGYVSLLIKEYFPHHNILAVDVELSDKVRIRLEKQGIKTINKIVLSEKPTPFNDNSFDAIIFLEVLEHIIANPILIFFGNYIDF